MKRTYSSPRNSSRNFTHVPLFANFRVNEQNHLQDVEDLACEAAPHRYRSIAIDKAKVNQTESWQEVLGQIAQQG